MVWQQYNFVKTVNWKMKLPSTDTRITGCQNLFFLV